VLWVLAIEGAVIIALLVFIILMMNEMGS